MVRTRAVTRICPLSAAATRRAASTTGVPKTSPSSKATSPMARPTRNAIGTGADRDWCSVASWAATAAARAATADGKVAMTPSPVFFTSDPPWAATTSRRRAKCSPRSSSKAASPRRTMSSVEPTRSVKSTASTPLARLGS